MSSTAGRNVLGGPLKPCSVQPATGFLRDGHCRACREDFGQHLVCAEMTEDFLGFTRDLGNDLSTPLPEHGFPGLRPGDRWCLCARRWLEAYHAGEAPPVILSATHESVLELILLSALEEHATA